MSRPPQMLDTLVSDRADPGYDPMDPQVQADPYPYYDALRQDAPVYPVPSMNGWAVSRHDDVRFVLDQPALFSSRIMAGADRLLLGADPPAHQVTRVRVQPHFTPAAARRLEAGIRSRCEALINRMLAAPAPELASFLAVPLPVATISALLGIETADHARFAAWSQAYVAQATGIARGAEQDDPAATAQQTEAFRDYMRGLVQARRTRPGDDLISLLARDGGSEPGQIEDVVDLCMLLLVGGNETTANLLTNAVNVLLERPALLDKALDTPELASAIVRETLRYDPPVQLVLRLATEDVEIAGRTIPAGATVLALLGAANRDPAHHPEAAHFDPHRQRQKHLSFGSGIHFCIGAHLAELQARIALACLLERSRRVGRGTDPAKRLRSFQLRGYSALPLTLEPR